MHNVKKLALVVTRVFDAPIERVGKAWTWGERRTDGARGRPGLQQ